MVSTAAETSVFRIFAHHHNGQYGIWNMMMITTTTMIMMMRSLQYSDNDDKYEFH